MPDLFVSFFFFHPWVWVAWVGVGGRGRVWVGAGGRGWMGVWVWVGVGGCRWAWGGCGRVFGGCGRVWVGMGGVAGSPPPHSTKESTQTSDAYALGD